MDFSVLTLQPMMYIWVRMRVHAQVWAQTHRIDAINCVCPFPINRNWINKIKTFLVRAFFDSFLFRHKRKSSKPEKDKQWTVRSVRSPQLRPNIIYAKRFYGNIFGGEFQSFIKEHVLSTVSVSSQLAIDLTTKKDLLRKSSINF